MAGPRVTLSLRWTKALAPNFSAADLAVGRRRASARCLCPSLTDIARADFSPAAKMLSALAPGFDRLQDTKAACLPWRSLEVWYVSEA